jgi:tyrosyl-tRNA synthetase
MTEPRSEFLRTLVARGSLHQCTDLDGLDAALDAGRVTAYIGFDCTAPSLHIGHLVGIMMLRRLQQAGHRPIVVVGGGTSKVGDPSGKDEARRLLDDDEIDRNIAGIRRVFDRYLTCGNGPTDAILVDNAAWLDELAYVPFLREIGRHFTVNRMLSYESVRLRLEREQALSFLEFNYMILQAYDYLELHRRHGCRLQMGGSDQWGNIVNGVELVRRADDHEVFGLTAPLLLTAAGQKMGKSVGGAVWLNAEQLSPYDFWQFWRNVDDAEVGRLLRLFTELPLEEIARLEALAGQEANEAKKVLANEVTRLCHGPEAAARAAETARRTFEEGAPGADLPTIGVARAELAAGIPAFELLHRAGLAASGGEARRLIHAGGARLNDRPITSEVQPITLADAGADGTIKLSAGKKRHALLRTTDRGSGCAD